MTVNFENQDLDPEQVADQAQIERERAADEGMIPPAEEHEGGDQLASDELVGHEAAVHGTNAVKDVDAATGGPSGLENPDVTEIPDVAPGAEG